MKINKKDEDILKRQVYKYLFIFRLNNIKKIQVDVPRTIPNGFHGKIFKNEKIQKVSLLLSIIFLK